MTMAITKKFINADQSKLKAFLEETGFFGSVTVDSSNSSFLDLYDDDDNLLCKISPTMCMLYWDDNASHHLDITLATGASNGGVTYAYSCPNGIMLACHQNQNYNSYIMVTKTNNDKLAFIVSYTGSSESSGDHVKNFFPIAWGDDGTLAHPSGSVYNQFTITPNTRNQTQITPFVTYAEEGMSYTPNAGWFSASQNYSTGDGKITTDDGVYISNGYWCIKDGGDEI